MHKVSCACPFGGGVQDFFIRAIISDTGKEILFFCDKLKVPVVGDPVKLSKNEYE